jgi:hypothetical protein
MERIPFSKMAEKLFAENYRENCLLNGIKKALAGNRQAKAFF